ncbi:sulfotransferase family protein [Lyngbya confervoides]|uniref:Sulfotransferase n=1 Tax=Lyngbya confervoides BDU141951 TaxID=1574623 RepID=A0ABD4SZN9_9CYAN|nr:sulfotransferase [Lyngbya confervoides]MCM1981522.1 sulfotransferase [Lyngbya confervoides BDU141951]
MNATAPDSTRSTQILPNFLIIGAAKAGTTSLYDYLSQHPQVFMSPLKEPKYFALEGEPLNFQGPSQIINHTSVNSLAEYCQLFSGVRQEQAIGEASPLYLFSEQAARRIRQRLPQVKLIAILRNPVDRAFSSYSHLLREGFETLEFEAALDAEPERIRQRWAPLWYYQAKGFYARQLSPYFEEFPPEQIKIYLFEDFCQDTLGVVQEIYQFIGVDPRFEPQFLRRNVSGIPKNKALHRLLTQDNWLKSLLKGMLPVEFAQTLALHLKNHNLGEKVALRPETRRRLQRLYREDIQQLEVLIGRDLSPWLQED